MSIEALTEAAHGKNKDDFENGTVVRWTSAGRYLYAAIKTEAGWFTTATTTNPYVEQRIDFEELLEIGGRSENTDVMVSGGWVTL